MSLFGTARINDVADAGDSKRRLSYIGRDDDEPVALGRRFENEHLLVIG